jgi:GT2 family glycosyltransferase
MRDSTVVFIVLNWNDWQSTLYLLSKLISIDCGHIACKFLVVDNGSTDGSLKFITKWLIYNKIVFDIITEDYFNSCKASSNIILLVNRNNKGYSGGMNTGIRYALECLSPSFLLLLNNDIDIDLNFFRALYYASGDIRGPRVLNYYNNSDIPQPQVDFNIPLLSLFSKISSNVVITTRHYRIYNMPFTVQRLEGSCYMVRSEVFRRIGLFDESFFNYWEDTDFFRRARKERYKIVIVPASVVRHRVGSINLAVRKSNPRAAYYLGRNGILFIRKHYTGLKRYIVYILYLISSIYMFAVYLIYLRHSLSALSYILGIIRGLLGETGFSSFLERYVKKYIRINK